MKNKEKKVKRKKPSLIRLYWALFCFLIGTLLILAVFVVPFFLVDTWWIILIYVIVVYLLNTILALFIFNSKSQVNFKTSWLVVVLALPLVGALIYLLFAHKITTKKKRKLRFNKIRIGLWAGKEDSEDTLAKIQNENGDEYAISRYLYKQCQASVYEGNEVHYYSLGEYAYPSILEELSKAKKFIFVEYFIIEDGYMFGQIYNILATKAKEGLDVRLIYDDFGSVGKVEADFYMKARKEGIKCYSFNRIRPTVDIRQNSRDHRKIIVIDGVCGFTGGCNLADEYINKKVRFGVWKDNFVMVKGPAISGLTSLFLSNWSMITQTEYKDASEIKQYQFPSNIEMSGMTYEKEEGAYVQTFGEVPFDGEDAGQTVILHMINRAKKYIYISTPYLNPSEEIMTALENAAKSGIDVRIITPGIPDKKVAYFLTRSYYATLLDAGVKIYEYTPGFNHAKMYLIDDKIAFTGTINLDYRSLFLHFENGIVFYNGHVIEDIKKDFIEMFKVSKPQYLSEWLYKPWYVRLGWSILKIISPLF